MVKSVVSNSMVAHLWANQSQDSARSYNGNFSFDGPVLYSYSTRIGYMATGIDGGRVPLITEDSHSITTQGKHICPAHRATSYKAFVVPYLGNGWNGRYRADSLGEQEGHAMNLAALVKRYDDAKVKFLRAINFDDCFRACLDACLEEAQRYAITFGLEQPQRDVWRDMDAIRADHERRRAKRETPAYLAKKARELVARDAREAEARRVRALSYAETIAEWIAGANVRPPYGYSGDHYSVRLRIKGDTLETSLGATVPLAHAIRVFHAVAQCHATGTTWQRNGHTLHVGQFQVDRIEANGDFDAGCHHIEWSECERVAKLAGVLVDASAER